MAVSPAAKRLQDRILDYFNIQPGELRPTLGLAAYLLFGIASVISLKAAADSLFLKEFGAQRLPSADLSVTVLVAAVVSLYLRLSNRLPLGRLISGTQIFLAASLLLLWGLLRWDVAGAPVLLYVWVGVFTVLITSQAWSLAGSIFTTRQAKRLFSVIGSGGILGAALGGQFTSRAGPHLGTENIPLAAVGLLLVCALIVSRLSRTVQTPAAPASGKGKTKASIRQSLRLVGETRYLSLITIALFLSTLVSTLVKYQFKATVEVHFLTEPEAMTPFFGDFYGYLAVVSFLFHVLLTGRLLRWIGLGLCLFILPSALLVGATALLLSSSLGAAALARASDQGFRHSVDRASVELLYVPIGAAIRGQVKSFLDMVVSRAADGLASLVLLLLVGLQLKTQEVSWVSLTLVVAWLFVVWQLRGEYIANLRNSIERQDISAEELLRQLAESSPPAQLEESLEGSDPRAIETAVDWMQFSGVTARQAQLASLLTHESATIRRKAMATVSSRNIDGCEKEVLKFLEREDRVESRWQALEYLERQDPAEALPAMKDRLASDDRDLAATVAVRLLHHRDPDPAAARKVFLDYLEETAGERGLSRAAAARLLGLAPKREQWSPYLLAFLEDSDPAVVRAALKSAVVLKPADKAPAIIAMLGSQSLRREAREALAALGEPILERLKTALTDASLDIGVRRRIPRVVSDIGGPEAARSLVACLEKVDRAVGIELLRALGRIRGQEPRAHFASDKISGLLVLELKSYYQTAILLGGIPAARVGEGIQFLRRTLNERLKQHLEWSFLLLELIYPQREIRDSYYRIVSGRRDLRANAVEFLDSRLSNPVRQMLLPLLENGLGPSVLRAGREFFRLRKTAYGEVLETLLHSGDPWLQACASYVAAESRMFGLAPVVEKLSTAPDPMLAESALAARDRLAKARSEEDSG